MTTKVYNYKTQHHNPILFVFLDWWKDSWSGRIHQVPLQCYLTVTSMSWVVTDCLLWIFSSRIWLSPHRWWNFHHVLSQWSQTHTYRSPPSNVSKWRLSEWGCELWGPLGTGRNILLGGSCYFSPLNCYNEDFLKEARKPHFLWNFQSKEINSLWAKPNTSVDQICPTHYRCTTSLFHNLWSTFVFFTHLQKAPGGLFIFQNRKLSSE